MPSPSLSLSSLHVAGSISGNTRYEWSKRSKGVGFFKIILAQQQKNAAEAIGRKLFMRHKAIVCLLSCDVFKKGRVVHANIHTEKTHTRGLGASPGKP
jgi:hypothetical protein